MSFTPLLYLNPHTQGKFSSAVNYAQSSTYLNKTISTRFDLAETYYQLGLAYHKKGHVEKSQANFQEAIRLFKEMEAPKQVERVRQAMLSLGIAITQLLNI